MQITDRENRRKPSFGQFMYWLFFYSLVGFLVVLVLVYLNPNSNFSINRETPKNTWWDVQSVDTMKYSRDEASRYLEDSDFDLVIDRMVADIADTGANYVAIATPYDEEFVPFLERWVAAARKHNLKVWFRGNWSAWEGWFGREKNMSFDEHIQKSVEFIHKHPNLFRDGDSFTACPECENGAAGDPRYTGMVDEYRQFLIRETKETKNAFDAIDKNVTTNWLSMNGDVARLVMDKKTTFDTGGLVTIDHYVKDPTKLNQDVNEIASNSGGKVFLGEYGAPIPDIHGDFSESEQAEWIDQSLNLLASNPNIVGLSYWTNMGGSTQLWDEGGQKRLVVDILSKYFNPRVYTGEIVDELGNKLDQVNVKTNEKETVSNNGLFTIAVHDATQIKLAKDGYGEGVLDLPRQSDMGMKITLLKQNPSWWDKLLIWFRDLF